jgi:processive 1,2-diacylglycerol beta-glucosyltransferase
LTLDRLNTRPLVKLLQQENPDLAICTHFLPAEILVCLRRKKALEIPVGVVATDFDVHAMWLYRDVDWYFVACEETKVRLATLGILPETIRVTGIPIDPAFAMPKPKQEVRLELGLDPHWTMILVSAGGFGMGPVESLVRALHDVRRPLQLVVVCGRNAALERRLKGFQATVHPMRVLGFTTEMEMDECSRSVGGEGRGPDQFRGTGMRLGSGDREPDPGSGGAEQRSLPGGGCRYPL